MLPELEKILTNEVKKGVLLQENNRKLVGYVGQILEDSEYLIIIKYLSSGSERRKAEDGLVEKTLELAKFVGTFVKEQDQSSYGRTHDYQLLEKLDWVKTTEIKGETDDDQIILVGNITNRGQIVYNEYEETMKSLRPLN